MQADVVLTVSESKRLIAKGVVALPCVKRAWENGYVVVCTGTTNAYVAEELLGEPMLKPPFITGHTTPANVKSSDHIPGPTKTDLVFKNGQIVEGMTKFDAAREFRAGDVLIKGANALNYEQQVAGVLIGHPEGGTVGGVLGPIIARKATLVIPCGLEKLVAHDIVETQRMLGRFDERLNGVSSLWPVTGEIVTEIEALQLLTGCEAIHYGSGGILGAEGSVRFMLTGDDDAVRKALELCQSLQGEPSFLEQCRQAKA